MKRFFAISTILISWVALYAQNNIFNSPDNKLYMGIRLDTYMVCPSRATSSAGNVYDDLVIPNGKEKGRVFNPGPGIQFGAVFNIPIYANLYIEPGLKLYFEQYTGRKEANNIYFDYAKLSKCGFHLPLMIGYHFNFTENLKVMVFTGPELEVGFHSKLSMDWYKANTNFSVNLYDNDNGMKHVPLFWTVGAGVAYKHYQLTISGNIGTQDISKDPDDKYRENQVVLGLGMNF